MDQKSNLSHEGLSVEYYGDGHEDCLDAIRKGNVQLVLWVQKAYWVMRGLGGCCSILCVQETYVD